MSRSVPPSLARRWRARACLSASVLASVLACEGAAEAKQVDLIGGFTFSPTSNSDYRTAADAYAYDTHGKSAQYEGELAAMFGVGYHGWITVGPLVRGSFGRLGAPYGGVSPITTDAAFVAARAELAVLGYPRLFFWADAGLGLGWIGANGDHPALGVWEVRGGAAMRLGTDAGGARIRLGWGYSPTMSKVTPAAGRYDFGGFVLALDGVIRVLG
jgi:hypothetical protein